MSAGRQAAVFDFDGTLIRGDSVTAMLFFARKRGLISPFYLLSAAWYGLLYHLGAIDAAKAKRRAHAFLARLGAAQRESFLRDFAATLTARIYPPGRKQLDSHRQAGDLVILCSASCQCYMRYVAETLDVDALLCTPSAADGSMLGPNCRGPEKVRRVYQWLDEHALPHNCLAAAYGDTPGDADILRASQKPVLVNPRKKLARLMPEARQVWWRKQE